MRNSLCSCGSGKRYKHCHGSLSTAPDPDRHISDESIMNALKRADDEGIRLGEEPSTRTLSNVQRALREFGHENYILAGFGAPPIVERAISINELLFVPRELQVGGMHLGAFLFRDMFCQLYAPVGFGQGRIDFWQMLDLNDFQKGWLAESTVDLARFKDQSIDILDFGYGWSEFGHQRTIDPRGRDLIWRAHVQLEAAAATAAKAYDYRGTIQSALLGTELALKAGLAALGVSNEELSNRKAIGHNLQAATNRLAGLCDQFDGDRVMRVVSTFPDFVKSRYTAPSPSRVETGEILMGAQYVASEVTRQFSDRDSRRDNPEHGERTYPD